jgi:predicted hydrocarbon binding protein
VVVVVVVGVVTVVVVLAANCKFLVGTAGLGRPMCHAERSILDEQARELLSPCEKNPA